MKENEHMTQIRTRVPDDIYDALAARATLHGTSIAGHIRDVLTASVKVTRSQASQWDDAERAQWIAWSDGVCADKDKRNWRARVDSVLRAQGVALPLLKEGDADSMIEWACAVHPHTRLKGSKIVPPRYKK
jgi:plasmid stability protein